MRKSPKQKGTEGESAVVAFLRANGFEHADRGPLRGSADQGDIAVCPGIVAEVKAGAMAENAGAGLVADWLNETERERRTAKADIGLLVIKRKAFGHLRAGQWWCVVPSTVLASDLDADVPVRLTLADACHLLRLRGWGTAP